MVRARRSATAARVPGGSQSSLSTHQTYRPVACRRPVLRAAPSPTLRGSVTTLIRLSRAAYPARISAQPSGEASSTAITSKSVNDWPSSESRHSARYSSTR